MVNHSTAADQPEVRAMIDTLWQRIKSGVTFGGLVDSEADSVLTVDMNIPISLCEGISAGEAREYGVEIPESVPDCATMKDGRFQWVECRVKIQGSPA